MAKKMHDILSPTAKRKIDNTVKELVEGLSVEPKKKRVSRKKVVQEPVLVAKKTIKKRFPLKEVLVGGVVVVLLLGWYGVTKLPKADIEIWPKTETLTLSQKINADKSATAVDAVRAIIPATYMEEAKEGTQE